LSLPVTVVTVAFGNSDIVRKWVRQWSDSGASCLISDNGNQIPSDISAKTRVLPFTGNKGFGAGINRAVLEADTPIILITNPDTLPANSHSLEDLHNYHSRGNLTGATTVDPEGNEVYSTGIWPNINWVRSQIFKPAESLFREDRIDWLQGSLIMVHKNDFLKAGGFNSRYPLYFEDVDLCSRGPLHGLGIDFCRESQFIHDEGTGSSKVTATRLSCFHWGMLEFFKDHDSANAKAVKQLLITKCILRMSAFSIRDVEITRGYYRALSSILSGLPPRLPGARND